MRFLQPLSIRLCLSLLALALGGAHLWAAPYGPEGKTIAWDRPAGGQVTLRVFGDEFHARTETSDGYSVVFDPATKDYNYATLSPDGEELVSTGVSVAKVKPGRLNLLRHIAIPPATARAKALARFKKWDQATGNSQRWSALKAQRQAYDEAVQAAKEEDGPSPAPPSFTTIGEKVGLTLLIDFSDAVGTIPQAEVINYCNGDNYTGYSNNGSVKKYYQDNSKNLLTYTNTVTAYIRMAQPKTYYNDTSVDCGVEGRKLISDAIDIMKALPNYNSEILPTFDTLTVDGSNRVVACNVFFAGASSGVWSYGLWPHSYALSSAKELSAGGKKVYKYQITNLGTSLTLGTFCHENGHMLCGYPDIYDYDYDSKGGAGGFCLMNSGGHGTNPVLICAYLKRASGWTTETNLTSTSNLTGTLVSTVGATGYNQIYRYANPGTSTEYFLFENRRKTGRDANIAASGIAIWHIDELGNKNNQSLIPNTTHANYEVTLVQADNLWHFQNNTNSGDSKDLYYLGNTAAAYTNIFSDGSSPNAHWWSGASSGINAHDFSSAATTMTVQFGQPANTIAVISPNGGENIYFESTRTVTWTATTSGYLKIELLKAGSLHTVLSASEANDGSYSWLVSSGLPAGSDYTIRISSVNTPAYADTSDAAFTLMPQPTLAGALDTTGLTWTTSGNANWFPQSTTTHDGVDAAQSGALGDSQNASMQITTAQAGSLTFWWKVSSEANYDYLRFYLDDVEQAAAAGIAGEVNWTQKSLTIPSGIHTLKWTYAKDYSVASGSDAAWVDQVVFIPSTQPEIAVEQPAGTNLTDGSATVNCGSSLVGASATAITFTVRNTGDANLTGLAISKDGSHGTDFTVGTPGASTLAPGTSTTFKITFTPVAAGTRTAAIHIASNDANENPFDISLTGTAAKGNPVVTTWPTASAISYGQTLASSVLSGGSATPAGTFAFTTPATAPAAGTAAQSVTFTPTDTANYNPVAGSVEVTVNTPEIAVEQPLGSDLTDGSATIDCGSADLGFAAAPLTFTVRNTGAAVLAGLVLSADGANAADFALGAPGVTTLDPGASATFSVTFTPGAAGSRTAAVHLASNDADENPFDLALTGYGRTPLESWRFANFGSEANSGTGADTAQADGDALPNLLEYAMKLDPGLDDPFPIASAETPTTLSLIYPRNQAATDVKVSYEESDDLGVTDPWSPVVLSEETVGIPANGVEIIKATLTLAPGENRKFLRIKVGVLP